VTVDFTVCLIALTAATHNRSMIIVNIGCRVIDWVTSNFVETFV